MDDKHEGSARQPSWWQNLVPQRWRPEAPASNLLGPAGLYADRQVEKRLQSPEWNSDATNPTSRALVNRPSFPLDGRGAPTANQRPYPV